MSSLRIKSWLFPLFFTMPAVLAVFFCFSAPALHAVEPLGKTHVDKKVGYSIRLPKDWEFVASPDAERYIIGKFIAKRAIRTKGGEYIQSHRPEMRIIAFTPDNKEIESSKREEKGLGGVTISYLTEKNPYRDFKEYVKRNTRGFYFGEETESKVKEVPCTFIEVIMEQNRPPLRRLACTYHLGDLDVAVYFEVLEQWYPKYEKLFKSSLKSFKKIKREMIVKDVTGGTGGGEKMTRKQFIASKTENLPDGWSWMESKRHLVIYHTDKKFAGKLAAFADAMRNTIEKQFKIGKARPGGKKSKEASALPMIRICGSVGEFNSYCDNSGGFNSYNAETQEVVSFDGTRDGWSLDEVGSRVSRGIYWQYLAEIFPYAGRDWYATGMGYYYSCFKKKGSGCKFVKDTSSVVSYMRDAVKRGEVQDLKALIAPGGKGIRSTADYYKAGMFVCFLNTPAGRKKPWKGVGDRYVENMKMIYDELSGKLEDDIEGISDEESREDAEERGKKIILDYTDFRKTLKERTFEETFGDWKETDWSRLEKAWADWAV
jgi:hypothetical protein